jgi:hypothetical protein
MIAALHPPLVRLPLHPHGLSCPLRGRTALPTFRKQQGTGPAKSELIRLAGADDLAARIGQVGRDGR